MGTCSASPGKSQFEAQKDSYIKPCAGQPGVQLPDADQDSARPLVHDGGQPWGIRRQQVLGTRPHRLDHRGSLRDLLAASTASASSEAERGPAAATSRARAPARTARRQRPAAVRVRPPPRRPPDRGRRRGRTRLPGGPARGGGRAVRLRRDHDARAALAGRAQRLQAAHRRGARGAVPARAAQRRARRRRLALRARDRRPRAAQDQPRRAARRDARP